MANLNKTTTTNLTNTVQDFSVDPRQTDGVSASGLTYWNNPNFTKYHQYYKTIPNLKKPIDAIALYTVGNGYTANAETKVILDHISGWGEDTFDSIMWNMIVTKKVNGDAFAQIIRDGDKRSGTLLNIKPLDPASVRVVVNKDGRISHYEIVSKGSANIRKEKWEILHLVNDRFADEIHGTSVIEACQWYIDAKDEAQRDWRRISHRSTIRVMFVDVDNTTRQTQLKEQYAEAIKNGELMIIPAKKPDVEFEDLVLPPVESFMRWIQYLDDGLYQQLGVPKVILGGSSEFTEASSKTALLTWDQIWQWEQRQLEADLWNQLYIKVHYYEPVSLKNELISDEDKNTSQTGFQPNDARIGQGNA